MKKDGEKLGLSVPLLPSTEEDRVIAHQMKFKAAHDLQLQEKKRKLLMKSSSIFGKTLDSDSLRKAKVNLLAKRQRLTS